MKVLHLIDSGGLYGAEKMLLALISAQVDAGLKPILLSCGEPQEKPKAIEIEAEKMGFEVVSWRMTPGLNLRGMFRIISWAKKHDIDMLHSHGFKFNVLIGLIPKVLRARFNWVVTIHGYLQAKLLSKRGVYQFLDKQLSRRSDQLCLVSPAMLQLPEFKSHKKTSVILNGIESEAVGEPRLSSQPKVYKLLVLGRLSPEKGISFLIEAISQLRTQGINNIRVTLMGTGPLEQQIQAQIAELDLTQLISLAGFVSEPVKQFNQYDALVMPSLTEGIPITLLEAMREKLPIIASRVGGIPFVLGEDYQYLVEPGLTESLSNKLKAFVEESDTKEIEQLVDKNHARFVDKFTAEKMHQQYLEVYKRVSS